MQGSTYKRCPCPPRRDARGRRIPCGRADGSWSYKVDLPRDDGRRRQLAKGGFATKREAEQAMAELIAKAARGPVVQVSRQSLGEYLTGWLEVIRPTLSPAAWTNYRTCVDRYVAAVAVRHPGRPGHRHSANPALGAAARGGHLPPPGPCSGC